MQGIAGSTRGLGFAVMGDMTGADTRATGMGYISAAMAAAFTVGPLLGGAFMGESPGPVLASIREFIGAPAAGFDHRLPALIGAGLNFVGLIVLFFGFTETFVPGSRQSNQTATEGHARRDLMTLLMSVAVLLVGVLYCRTISSCWE